jgi:hypothetical protein
MGDQRRDNRDPYRFGWDGNPPPPDPLAALRRPDDTGEHVPLSDPAPDARYVVEGGEWVVMPTERTVPAMFHDAGELPAMPIDSLDPDGGEWEPVRVPIWAKLVAVWVGVVVACGAVLLLAGR